MIAFLVSAYVFSNGDHKGPDAPAHVTAHARLPRKLWGVTVDNVADTDQIVDSLRDLKSQPTARIVFDPGSTPDDYRKQVHAIRDVAFVMGSPIDSAPPSGQMTVEAYRKRLNSFMDGLSEDVDVWEIGNEVNGDWTCDSELMAEKIEAGVQVAKAHHRPAALTLFYSDFYKGQDREMVAWSNKYLPESVRRKLDYVFVSFYPDTATGPHPDWKPIFGNLAKAFRHAKLGFGELGLRNADFSLSQDEAKKNSLIERYYGMSSILPHRFVGGYFWWTYRQDALKRDSLIWKTFHDVIR